MWSGTPDHVPRGSGLATVPAMSASASTTTGPPPVATPGAAATDWRGCGSGPPRWVARSRPGPGPTADSGCWLPLPPGAPWSPGSTRPTGSAGPSENENDCRRAHPAPSAGMETVQQFVDAVHRALGRHLRQAPAACRLRVHPVDRRLVRLAPGPEGQWRRRGHEGPALQPGRGGRQGVDQEGVALAEPVEERGSVSRSGSPPFGWYEGWPSTTNPVAQRWTVPVCRTRSRIRQSGQVGTGAEVPASRAAATSNRPSSAGDSICLVMAMTPIVPAAQIGADRRPQPTWRGRESPDPARESPDPAAARGRPRVRPMPHVRAVPRAAYPRTAAAEASSATVVRAVGRENQSARKPIVGGPSSIPP